MLEEKRVTLNGKIAQKSARLAFGDVVEVDLPDPDLHEAEPTVELPIVFEDDARLNKLEEIEINDEDYYYLGGFEYKKGKICLQHAMYYPSWERLEKMLVILNNPKKLKTIDYMFANFIQPKFKYGFSNFYYQEGDSLIQKNVKRTIPPLL
jgi:hypothetical protein